MTCTLLHFDSVWVVVSLRLWKESTLHSLRAMTCTLLHFDSVWIVVSMRLWKESTSQLANQDSHTASLRLWVETWKDCCFKLTLAGRCFTECLATFLVNLSYLWQSLRLSRMVRLWKESTSQLANQDSHTASLRLWVKTWKDCCFKLTLAGRCFTECLATFLVNLSYLWQSSRLSRMMVRLWKESTSQLANQDSHTASLRLWVEPWKGCCFKLTLTGRCFTECLATFLVNLSYLWQSSRLSRMALPSEKHVAHTESVAPAKAQLPEP
jgi:uncharacterized membrane protein YesL